MSGPESSVNELDTRAIVLPVGVLDERGDLTIRAARDSEELVVNWQGDPNKTLVHLPSRTRPAMGRVVVSVEGHIAMGTVYNDHDASVHFVREEIKGE